HGPADNESVIRCVSFENENYQEAFLLMANAYTIHAERRIVTQVVSGIGMNLMKFKVFLLAGTILLFQAAGADATPITFSQLTGMTGGSPAETGVYKADLSGIGLLAIQSITIADNS